MHFAVNDRTIWWKSASNVTFTLEGRLPLTR